MGSVSTEAQQYWDTLCRQAFNNDKAVSDFVHFFEGSKILNKEQLYEWTTEDSNYQLMLQRLGCDKKESHLFTLQPECLAYYTQTKSKIRSEWHADRQVALKQHLKALLEQESETLNVDPGQRISLVRQFVQKHDADLGSVPFLRGLAGMLKYQLRHKTHLVAWKMSEYVLTQNNEEAMESYIQLLKDVLGLQIVYQDDNSSKDQVVIDMDTTANASTEPELTWRMNPNFDNRHIQDILRLMPNSATSQTSAVNAYKITEIPRNQQVEHKGFLSWIFELLSRCLSLFTH